jgi:hypothetical protein
MRRRLFDAIIVNDSRLSSAHGEHTLAVCSGCLVSVLRGGTSQNRTTFTRPSSRHKGRDRGKEANKGHTVGAKTRIPLLPDVMECDGA